MATKKKQPRKVALINVFDYRREDYSAYWQIGVTGESGEGYRWEARMISYDPVGWEWQGKMTAERPDLPLPVYPPDVPVKQPEFLRMAPADQVKVIEAQEARRQLCAEIYEANQKPMYLIGEMVGFEDTRDPADTAAQKWVLGEIQKYRRRVPPKRPESGYVIAMGPFGMVVLMALGIITAVRNSILNVIRDAIDAGAGAGLLRIYDGTRPATCGTATTLGAELTCSDPCAPGASGGVMTFSAITADASANASITASWGRAVDSTGTCVFDFSVGTAGSDLNLNSTTITVGQEVSITSATITAPNA